MTPFGGLAMQYFFNKSGEAKEPSEQLADAQLGPQGPNGAPAKLVETQPSTGSFYTLQNSSWICITGYFKAGAVCGETGTC